MEYQVDFERIYNCSPDMCISLDIQTGKVISCNQTLVDILGYSKEECYAMSIIDFYHPDYHNKVKENFNSLSTTGVIVHTEFKLLKKNGETIEVNLQFTVIQNNKGETTYSNAVWRDITEIKEAERALIKEKAKVEHQNELIEAKNKDILDSINYAKRIQNAILPTVKEMKCFFPKSFVLYKPKDIVAGDFYWMAPLENGVLIAAADCTGHGVPGALVSVICNSALNTAVREFGLVNPGQILDKSRDLVIQGFKKSEDEVKDGMDISLCKIEGNLLSYSGANNPLWIIRNGAIIETKGDKQAIGKSRNYYPFTTHTTTLQKGDTLYLFTDGFKDQFGGQKGKKYMSSRFKAFLISIQDYSMEEQHKLLAQQFENWRGEHEQLDDVCVIGIRI